MRQHKKNVQNPSRPEAVQPTGTRENFSHFPENDIPNFILTNEIGLSLNSRSIHREANIAGLLNQYPIRAYQYMPSETGSDEKSKLVRKLRGLISNNFRDFRANDPLEEQSHNVSDVIWTTPRENSTIQSKQEKSKGELPSSGRSILPKAKAERFVK